MDHLGARVVALDVVVLQPSLHSLFQIGHVHLGEKGKVTSENKVYPTGPSSVMTWPAIRMEIFFVITLAKSINDGLLGNN